MKERIEYREPGHRYLLDKTVSCYISVDKKNVLNMSDKTCCIRWYQTELEIKNDPDVQIPVSIDDIEAVRQAAKGTVPDDRLIVMTRSRKSTEHAKEILTTHAGSKPQLAV